MTADSLDIPVTAGPTEATALGNIMLQLIALGDIESVEEGRRLLASSENVKIYKPENAREFSAAYDKFKTVITK